MDNKVQEIMNSLGADMTKIDKKRLMVIVAIGVALERKDFNAAIGGVLAMLVSMDTDIQNLRQDIDKVLNLYADQLEEKNNA